jgi:hypothetical protein
MPKEKEKQDNHITICNRSNNFFTDEAIKIYYMERAEKIVEALLFQKRKKELSYKLKQHFGVRQFMSLRQLCRD